MWCAHTLCYMSVGRVGEEELPLCGQSSTNVLLPINVFLAAVHHTNVACTQQQHSYSRVKNKAWECLFVYIKPHLYAVATVYFQGCPLHRSLHPSGPVLL